MNPYLLAELSRDRCREVRAEYARANRGRFVLRPLAARLLRAFGDRLFRLGVALDDVRVTS